MHQRTSASDNAAAAYLATANFRQLTRYTCRMTVAADARRSHAYIGVHKVHTFPELQTGINLLLWGPAGCCCTELILRHAWITASTHQRSRPGVSKPQMGLAPHQRGPTNAPAGTLLAH
jgi:hypothetical protein